MLVGGDPDNLFPVGMPLEHSIRGIVNGGVLTLDGFPCLSSAYAQFVAWDGTLWGSSLDQVPLDQLGRTDIVRTPLLCFPQPIFGPLFTQPAIVPIPEPSVLAIGILGVSLVALRRLLRRHAPA